MKYIGRVSSIELIDDIVGHHTIAGEPITIKRARAAISVGEYRTFSDSDYGGNLYAEGDVELTDGTVGVRAFGLLLRLGDLVSIHLLDTTAPYPTRSYPSTSADNDARSPLSAST